MQKYIGTKIIKAKPMKLKAATELLGRDFGYKGPLDENDDYDGYLVEYHDGYQAWSPGYAFNPVYRPITSMSFEQEIQAKNLTAPRVTPADIEANILTEHYFTANEGMRGTAESLETFKECGYESLYDYKPLRYLTFCVLVLKNGFTVTGESACASPENFDAEIGRKIARENAINKIWPLMGYQLKQRLHETKAN